MNLGMICSETAKYSFKKSCIHNISKQNILLLISVYLCYDLAFLIIFLDSPTHAVVHFIDHNSICTVPVKSIKHRMDQSLQLSSVYPMVWAITRKPMMQKSLQWVSQV